MSKLFVVPTPIGNFEDITLRALRVLKESDLVLAEDTRTSSNLFKHFGITTKLQPYHQYNEHAVLLSVLKKIASLNNVSIITDAGTPGISDPGYLLVRECIKVGIDVECLPGATALIPALVTSGLPCDKFVFEGFLPRKKGRTSKLEQLKNYGYTFVIYESPFRVTKTLEQLQTALGDDRKAVVSREISKIHETHYRGTLKELTTMLKEADIKGEVVICVAGNDNQHEFDISSGDTAEDDE